MIRKSKRRGWALRLLKPLLFIALVAGADHLAHWLGYQCLLTSLANSLSPLIGLSESNCFALLICLAAYAAFAVGRAVAGLLTAYR